MILILKSQAECEFRTQTGFHLSHIWGGLIVHYYMYLHSVLAHRPNRETACRDQTLYTIVSGRHRHNISLFTNPITHTHMDLNSKPHTHIHTHPRATRYAIPKTVNG